jgi:hypothetical protein
LARTVANLSLYVSIEPLNNVLNIVTWFQTRSQNY